MYLPSVCAFVCLCVAVAELPRSMLKGGMTAHCSAKRDFITKLMNSTNLQRTDSLSLSSLRCDGTAANLTEEIECMRTAASILNVSL